MENPLKAQKLKTNHKAKGMVAPFAFLFSIVFYISIFYFFSFSPSTLITDNKFWFFISNTLILIIAADYGAFSSSKDQKHDFYEEYALHSHATRRISISTSTSTSTSTSFVSQYPENMEKSMPVEEDHVTETNKEIPEKILEVVKIEPSTENFQAKSADQKKHPMMKAAPDYGTYCDHHQVINKKTIEPQTIRRSKSEKVKHVKALNDKKAIFHRSNTAKQHEHDEPSAELDEFSDMSNEELNRRVEEFIEKFNRQIRLQGAINRQV